MAIPPWAIPPAQYALIQLLTGLTVAFAPTASSYRPIAASLVVALAISFQNVAGEVFAETRASGPVVAMSWVNVLNALDLLVFSRVSFDEQVAWDDAKQKQKAKQRHNHEYEPQKEHSPLQRFTWALNIAWNYRRINTPWQIPKLPAFDPAKPAYVPSRGKFVFVAAAKVLVSGLIIHFFTIDPADPRLGPAIAELTWSKMILVPFRAGVTTRRILVQCLFTLSFGIICRAAIVAGYNAAAVVCVASGVHRPRDWPPIAGSLTDAWSLRRLWGKAWHQTLRKSVCSNADFVSSTLLRIPVASHWTRYTRLVFAFGVSGVVHVGMDFAFGIPLMQSGSLWFFGLQVVGIVLENAVEVLFGHFIEGMNPAVRRVIGYGWVTVFLLWSTPAWMNPIILRLYGEGQKVMSPFLCF